MSPVPLFCIGLQLYVSQITWIIWAIIIYRGHAAVIDVYKYALALRY